MERYCKETGAAWNVVRPSYIIGAVRDSALNFMIGLAIFGAVESYLGRPLNFPGDYAAWDREYCQSTALLNAHFQEWAVLTDEAANQAFNIQDGQKFTWGRFWAYLAGWYGTTWQPPTQDETKYKEVQCRHEDTPRGFVRFPSHGVVYSMLTGSLQIWSYWYNTIGLQLLGVVWPLRCPKGI